MCEAILRQLGPDRFESLSAGSDPAGFVHPLAIEAMRRLGVPMVDHTSKSWDEFAGAAVDAVITVCDAAAGKACPAWPQSAVTAHWPVPDPSYHAGTEEDRIEFAVRVAERLRVKIQALVNLDWVLDPVELKARLDFLGEI